MRKPARFGLSFFLGVSLLSASAWAKPAKAPFQDWQMVPGVRLGPIRKGTGVDALKRWFGEAQVREVELQIPGTSEKAPGVVLFAEDPERRLALVPGVGALVDEETGRRWKLPLGLRPGLPLPKLEAINGRGFRFIGFGGEHSGLVVDWKGGKLSGVPLSVVLVAIEETRISALEFSSLMGTMRLDSAQALVQKVAPVVKAFRVGFAE